MLQLLDKEKVNKKACAKIRRQKSCDTRIAANSCPIYHIHQADLTNTIIILMVITVIVIIMIIIIMIVTMAILKIKIRILIMAIYIFVLCSS